MEEDPNTTFGRATFHWRKLDRTAVIAASVALGLVILFAAATFYYYAIRDNQSAMEAPSAIPSEPSVASVTENPAEKIPETNPFKKADNPFNGYKNPFE